MYEHLDKCELDFIDHTTRLFRCPCAHCVRKRTPPHVYEDEEDVRWAVYWKERYREELSKT